MKQKLNRNITKKEIIKIMPYVLILLILIGIGSYAFTITDLLGTQNLGILNNQELSLTFVEGENDFRLPPNPMSDADGKAQTTYYEFQVSSTSNIVYKLEYAIYLKELGKNAVDSKDVKVYLTKVEDGAETEVLAPRSIDRLYYGIAGDNTRLLEKDAFNHTDNTKTTKTNVYRLRTWLSEDAVIQSEVVTDVEKTEDGINLNAASGGYQFKLGVSTIESNNLDTSKANAPALLSNMLPVYYDEKCNNNAGCWEKADSTNTNENFKWYNYDEKMWANAVTVDSTNRATYIDAPEGTEIPMDEINAMWVWIPRYTYTYFNDGTNTPKEIQIQFEEGTSSRGTITCTDNVSGSGTTSQTCTDKNTTSLVAGTSTYTHPAFTFGDTPLTGFWMGKFENSATEIPTSASTAEHTIVIKPNEVSLKYKAVSYLFKDIRQMEKANNIYGFEQSSSTTFNLTGELTGDTNNLDTHMLKNIEWGAVAYLSHSKYGINKEININNSGNTAGTTNYYTGRSGGNVGGSVPTQVEFYGSSVTSSTNEYNYYGYYTYDGYKLNYGTNTKSAEKDATTIASTTGNIYGVYDMSGGAHEYVMGNIVNSSGAFYPSNAGQWSATTKPLSKYYDSYTYHASDTTTSSRGRLGDATVEMGQTGTSGGNWYTDYNDFPYSSQSWFIRGGSFSNGVYAGAFAFLRFNGVAYMVGGSRSSLCVLD